MVKRASLPLFYLFLLLIACAIATPVFADGQFIQVVVHVVNDNGGTASTSGFRFQVSGATHNSAADGTGDEAGTTFPIDVGGYQILPTSTRLPYTTAVSQDCTGSIDVGQTNVCTITEDDEPATLTVQNVVDNTGGGTATADQFSFSINAGASTPFEASGENDVSVDAGTYSVVEDATSSYTTTYSGCDSVPLSIGGSATCTITNTFDPSALPAPDPAPAPSGGGGGGGGGNGSNVLIATTPTITAVQGSVLGASTTTVEANTSSGSSACTPLLTAFMRPGAHNDLSQVKILQTFLNTNLSLSIPLTGYFGPITTLAVKVFQLKYSDDILVPAGLNSPTGFVLKLTQSKINALARS